MPRLPVDYSRTIIYKLCCLDQSINDIYIGHTTDFTSRKRQHKECCCNKNSKKYGRHVYQFIREHGGWENWQMIQIEEYPCNNKREAEARERYCMEELKSTLNSKQSFITEEEKKEYKKEYEKSDKYKEYLKIYRQTDTYKKSQKTDSYKEWKKEWNKEYMKTDKRKEYQKEYMKEYDKTDKRKQYNKQYKKIWEQKKALYLNELKCYNI